MRVLFGVSAAFLAGAWLIVAAVPASAAATAYACGTTVTQLFDNSNPFGVTAGGTAPTFSTGGKAFCLDQVQTYHWNNRGGPTPGQLWLTGRGGRKLGPWQAKGSAGTDNVPNVNWYYHPGQKPPVVIDGAYSCGDSSPETWSSNKQSGGHGFCHIFVRDVIRLESTTTFVQSPAGGAGGGNGGGAGVGSPWPWIVGIVFVAALALGGVSYLIWLRPRPLPGGRG